MSGGSIGAIGYSVAEIRTVGKRADKRHGKETRIAFPEFVRADKLHDS